MTIPLRVRPLFLTLATVAALSPLEMQAQEWTVDASAGRAVHRALTAGPGAHHAMFGLRYEGAHWLYLSAGIPLDSTGLPWGALGLGGRILSAGRVLSAGLDLEVQAHGYRDPRLQALGGGTTLEALPLVSLTGRPARLELRSGILHYTSAFGGVIESRTLHKSDVRLTLIPLAALEVIAEGRYLRAAEGSYPFAGGSAVLSHGRAEVWGTMGWWLSDVVREPAWGAGTSLGVGDRTQVRFSLQQEALDPLYWSLPRRSWSLGVNHRLGRSVVLHSPSPVLPPVTGGQVTLRIPLSASTSKPSIAGDFNGWNPVPMTRSGDSWIVTLRVPPGLYRYAFRSAEGVWFVPESVPHRVSDGMGGVSAILVVR